MVCKVASKFFVLLLSYVSTTTDSHSPPPLPRSCQGAKLIRTEIHFRVERGSPLPRVVFTSWAIPSLQRSLDPSEPQALPGGLTWSAKRRGAQR